MKTIRILICVIAVSLLTGSIPVYAEGGSNLDTGGGGISHGTVSCNWPGESYQGVRVTVVNAETGSAVGSPVDFSNKDLTSVSGSMIHFGKVSKLQYRSGAALTPQTTRYVCYRPEKPMPLLISSNDFKASIQQIRNYFCSEGAASMVAARVGMDTAALTNGTYKMVIEPVIYLIYHNLYYAMTTTEAGLYNRIVNGDLGARFPTVVMKNLALALYLEHADLGFAAWTGSKNTARTTEEMIQILGIGIVSYRGVPATEGTFDAVYRADTDVISAVTLSASQEINNDACATVTFTVCDRIYQMTGVVIPENGSQLVWVRWHTPSEPGPVTISISASRGYLSNCEIHAYVVDLNENPPPDPQADDRYNGFVPPSVPSGQEVSSLTWGVWNCYWKENWVWVADWQWVDEPHGVTCTEDCVSGHGHWEDRGHWEDQGYYEYSWNPYTAGLSASAQISPDGKAPTAVGNTMKSGYGLNMEVRAQLWSNAPSGHLTQAQNCVAYFPEFYYSEYCRLLECTTEGYSAVFEFQKNPYSTYQQRTHFTPVWFPNGTYTVYAQVLDAWTPAGMLQINPSSSVMIQGSLFADWHIRPVN